MLLQHGAIFFYLLLRTSGTLFRHELLISSRPNDDPKFKNLGTTCSVPSWLLCRDSHLCGYAGVNCRSLDGSQTQHSTHTRTHTHTHSQTRAHKHTPTYLPTHGPHSSYFWGLPYRILNMNPQKELLWGLWGTFLSPQVAMWIYDIRSDPARNIAAPCFGFRV